MKIAINENWKYTRYWDADMTAIDYNDLSLETVRLPHTVKEIPFNYIDESDYQVDAGYRYTFEMKPEWEGKSVQLTLGAASHYATVYVNGEEILQHGCGYTAIQVDITVYLRKGKNVIVVRCDSRTSRNVPPFGNVVDYMTFGGLYREAWLTITNKVHIKDVFVYSGNEQKEEKTMHTRVEVEGYKEGLYVTQRLCVHKYHTGCEETNTINYTKNNRNILEKVRKNTNQPKPEMLDKEKLTDSITMIRRGVKNVSLWTLDKPSLYDVYVTLYDARGDVLDEKMVTFGFRSVSFERNGFFLNGEKVKLTGLNRHQSFPYVGYAMPKSMQEQDADILKWELGVNAVRTSHYPQSQHFINRCDEIGLLVFTEIPGWQHIGDEEWQNQAVENVKEMITQYRNHPSIMIWGVRINESKDHHEFYTRTNEMAHRLDPSRHTGGVRCTKKSELIEDCYTYNDFSCDSVEGGCEERDKVTLDSDKGYLISEYAGHMYPTKMYDCEEHRLEHALRHAAVLQAVSKQKNIAGSFGWCMFDYNTTKDFGSGDHICYHGVMDAFRNPKMAAAIYESQQQYHPVLTVSSTMSIGDHPASMLGRVYAFTNADSLKLYKNEKFVKEYSCPKSKEESFTNLPVLLDDFIGEEMEVNEGFSHKQSEEIKKLFEAFSIYGLKRLPFKIKIKAAKLMILKHMTFERMADLFNKYVGNWGGTLTTYKLEAIKNDEVVSTKMIRPGEQVMMKTRVDHTHLQEQDTYDVAQVRLIAVDEYDNQLPYFMEPVIIKVEGNIDLIGPNVISFAGGCTGFYVKTRSALGGTAKVTLSCTQCKDVEIQFRLN